MNKTFRLAQGLVKQQKKFNYMNFYNFGMKTTQQTIIQSRPEGLDIQYSREYFELRANNPEYEKQLLEQEKQKQREELEKKFFENNTNDNNAKNFVKVNVNSQFVKATAKVREVRQFSLQNKTDSEGNVYKHPFIVRDAPKEPKILVTGLRRNIRSKIRKLMPIMRQIRKMHVYDALALCENAQTKTTKIVAQVIKQVMRHAKQRDLDLSRLYIHAPMMGKQRRFKLLMYKAKSQFGIMKQDIVQIKLTLEEKPIKEMYKQILVGKTPPALSYILREQLKDQQADLEQVRKWTNITTAKGRQQQRLMFKRRVIQQQQEYARYGVQVEKKAIEQRMLEVEASKWADEYEAQRLEIDQAAINKRMAVYKKNQQITGTN